MGFFQYIKEEIQVIKERSGDQEFSGSIAVSDILGHAELPQGA